MFDLLVRRGLVIDEQGAAERSILVAGGRVVALIDGEAEPAAREVIDAAGRIVLPGLVDSHVHFREPGLTAKEDFASGSAAAAAGGVTTVMVMPTDNPFTTTPERFAEKRAMAEGRAMVDFALQAGLGPDVGHVPALAELGAVSFEIFLSDLPAELLVARSDELVACLEAVRAVDGVAGVTPGDDALVAMATARARERHGDGRRAFAASRPPAAEALGVARAAIAADHTGVRVHLRQISTAASLAAAVALRSERMTAEATPHNLLLTDETFLRLGAVAKVLPPLRPLADVAAVRHGLADGRIDTVATDHAPHRPEEKAAGAEDIGKAPGGFPGVQTMLPLMLKLVADGLLTYPRLVEACCAAPARIFGLHPRKGTLRPGADADFVIVDPGRPMVIRNEDQLSRARLTPFDGMACPATPVLACLRGTVIMRDGRPLGRPAGRFVSPGG